MLDFLSSPWPWYVAGPLIGITIPILLLADNKSLGISSVFRHICAACIPGSVAFLKYDWKAETWNIIFALGIIAGGFIGVHVLSHPETLSISSNTNRELEIEGIKNFSGFMPSDIFSWSGLFSLKGFLLIVVGGFFVGFGTRYAGGCTSGHAIMGLSNLQFPSLVAVIGFFVGGLIMTHFILPYILKL